MAIGIADVMRECKNYFAVSPALEGAFSISVGALSPSGLIDADYIAITGSKRNNGVYAVGEGCTLEGAADETFTGTVYQLAPPRDFIALCNDIMLFTAQNGTSDTISESFGSYSHTRATGQNGAILGWQSVFAERLRPFMRMFSEVSI